MLCPMVFIPASIAFEKSVGKANRRHKGAETGSDSEDCTFQKAYP